MNKEHSKFLYVWRNIEVKDKIFTEITYINDVYIKLEEAEKSVASDDV